MPTIPNNTMFKLNSKPILSDIGDKLDRYLTKYSQLKNENIVYNENEKKLNLTKFIPKDVLQRILSEKQGNWYNSISLYEKFFNLSVGRDDRYSEYEQIIFRIPEASQALQIYVDSVLAPDIGESNDKLVIDTYGDDDTSIQARKVLEMIFRKSKFYKMLPQIIYTSLLYGDCFVEIEPTSNGVRYVLLPTKDCSLIYDQKTDIEMGLLVKLNQNVDSNLKDILNRAYPDTILDVPEQTVAIVSDKTILANKKNKFKVANLEKQMTELLKDVYKDSDTKFKYLAPHRYVRFPIFYNNNYYPYGTSIIDSIRSIAKQLLLTESNLALYRATRTPLRSMWTINVTGVPTDEISALINNTKQMVRRQKIINNENGSTLSIDSIPEIMGEQDDVWTTEYNGEKLLSYENLPTPDLTPYTNDVDYFRKKLLSGLGIPPSYLGEEEGGSTRALLTLEDVRFSRTIKRLQSDFNESLEELANLCFALINESVFINKVFVTLPLMTSVEANMKAENLSKRLDTCGTFSDMYPNVPKLWVMKNIGGFTDGEIQEMEDSINDQLDLKIFADQKFGEDNESENSSGGGFGGDFGGSDFGGSTDFGAEEDFGGNDLETEGPMDFGTEETNGGNEAINNEQSELNF